MNVNQTAPIEGRAYEPVDVGARFAGTADWGVMVRERAGEDWKLVCVGCTREEAGELAGRLNAKPPERRSGQR